jgi:AcrR family transcriptional regulator
MTAPTPAPAPFPEAGPALPQRPREAELIRTATRLFRERGFHATSMQDLGEALRMNRGSLYHYIASKDDLLWTIMSGALELLERRVLPVLDGDDPPIERLSRAIHEHLRVAADHEDEFSLMQIELRALSAERRAEMVSRRDAYEARWRRAIEQGIANGELRDCDVRLAGISILSLCNWFTQWYRPEGPMTVDEVAEAFVGLFLTGLGRSATAGRPPEAAR